jgi:hypothetical protein
VIAKAHGSLLAIHLAWLGIFASPLSSFIPSLAIVGLSSLMDLPFISEIDAEIGQKLALWPADDQPLDLRPASPLASVIIEYLGVEVRFLINQRYSMLTGHMAAN